MTKQTQLNGRNSLHDGRRFTQIAVEDRKVSQLLQSSERRAEYSHSQHDVDMFWGLTEDKSPVEGQKKWKVGETICVLNCKSELAKLTEFLKNKKVVRSFYIQRKPKGLAGLNGTWLTPPYSPPFVVKYGSPGKPSLGSKNPEK
jgi:superfamily II DNA/RNA helicase